MVLVNTLIFLHYEWSLVEVFDFKKYMNLIVSISKKRFFCNVEIL